jgi:hypothetical protein
MQGSNGRPGAIRLVVGYATVAAALPYLALKAVWLTGGQLGVADPAVMNDASMVALNTATAVMDIVAIAMVLAFTHRWGLTIPAWLLLPPMWVATGLLVRFVTGVPVVVIAGALSGASPARAVTSGPVRPWVYALVYPGFAALGIGLMLAFVLYSRVRWGPMLRSSIRDAAPGATQIVQVPVANAAAVMAAAVGVLHLAWACGATIGLRTELVAQRTFSSHLLVGIQALMMLSAAVGICMMLHRLRGAMRFWVPLSLTWVGGGYLFAWGLWNLINVLGDTMLVRNASAMPLANLASLVQLIAGLVIGVVMLVQLAERQADRDRR